LSNGLKETDVIFRSEAVMVAHRYLDTEGSEILQKILFRLESVMAAKSSKYVILNAPNDRIEAITALLPGMKSPTVVPLAASGWSAIHSVLNEEKFWEVIDDLKKAGAQGILVVPIEKMIL
jgi:ATP phosphoribosyltransferase